MTYIGDALEDTFRAELVFFSSRLLFSGIILSLVPGSDSFSKKLFVLILPGYHLFGVYNHIYALALSHHGRLTLEYPKLQI